MLSTIVAPLTEELVKENTLMTGMLIVAGWTQTNNLWPHELTDSDKAIVVWSKVFFNLMGLKHRQYMTPGRVLGEFSMLC